MTPAVALHGVTVRFGPRAVLDRFDLDVAPGAWVCLIGPNGAGKTTALRAVAGLLRSYDGDVTLAGRPVARMSRRALSRAVAYVPQRPVMPPDMAVADYVLLGRSAHIAWFGSESAQDRARAAATLDRLDLGALAARHLDGLSGGEAQRAVLARAVAQEAPVLLLDEPTSALDLGHVQQVLDLVDELRHERGLTVLSAMHDLTLAGQFADELVLVRDGRAVARGPATGVLTEAALSEHYGARVRVLPDGDGGVVVVPARR